MTFSMKPVVLVGVIVLAGCAGRETDPRKAGFLSSIANQTDGTYQQRLDQKKARNAQQEAANEQTADETRALEAEQSRLQRRVKSTRSRIGSLEGRIREAKQGLPSNSARRADLVAVEAQLKKERRLLDQAAAAGDEDAVLRSLRRVGLIEEEQAL